MARTVDAILVGPGNLFSAAQGEAYPTNPSTAVAGNWEDIGYSEDGWTVEADKTVEDVFVAELIDPVASFKTAQTLRVTGAMAQVGLEQLQLSFGGGTISVDDPASGFDTYTPPTTDAQTEYSILLRTSAPGSSGGVSFVRDWQFPRVIASGAVAAQFTKAPAKAQVAMEFRALVPSSGSIMTVIDETS